MICVEQRNRTKLNQMKFIILPKILRRNLKHLNFGSSMNLQHICKCCKGIWKSGVRLKKNNPFIHTLLPCFYFILLRICCCSINNWYHHSKVMMNVHENRNVQRRLSFTINSALLIIFLQFFSISVSVNEIYKAQINIRGISHWVYNTYGLCLL